MARGWRYRIASAAGTATLAALAVVFVNHPLIQRAFSAVPFFGNPAPAVLANGKLAIALTSVLLVLLGAMWPLFKPHPRRLLDTVLLTQKRVLLGMVALAALGYYDYTWALPRPTLMLATGLLLVWLPAWMLAIRQRPVEQSRAVLVGDDPTAMAAIVEATEISVIGYVSPISAYEANNQPAVEAAEVTDGGVLDAEARLDELPNLGGLSRLDEVFVKHDVDTALLAFEATDRAEFFGTLDTCYERGVTTLVHRTFADSVLTAGSGGGDLVEVDLEPWDWQDYVVKRAFDAAFATVGLVALSPLIATIAAAIKVEDGGPVLYNQQRTAEFGETFTVYKFRSMVPDAEAETGARLSDEDAGAVDPRVTRVGRFIRRTHLDEIPQLWSILVGDMSVVGPRPERPELDEDIETGLTHWRRRWFVKPGLTGLAQINDVTGYEPERKLRYDIEYIRKQSFWFDLTIVVRQMWLVVLDATAYVTDRT